MQDADFDADLVHGGALDVVAAAFPGAPRPWVDLSTGINPWPWPLQVAPPVAHHLPTRRAVAACRDAMAAAYGADPACVLPVPGTELVIRLLPQLLGVASACVQARSYGDHERAWRGAGATVLVSDDPLAAAGDAQAQAVVVCNPDNPTGRRHARDALAAARERQAARGGWLVVDEAFADLDPAASLAPSGGQAGLVLLRSFGKFYGLAGLRLGALIAPSQVLEAARRLLGQWAVSGPALAAGAAACADTAWADATRVRLRRAREALDSLLQGAGIVPVGGTDLYRFVRVDDAWALWRRLVNAGVYVRRFAWSREHLRIGLPADEVAAQRLARALGNGAMPPG